MNGIAVMVGDRFRVHRDVITAFGGHAPGADTSSTRVQGETWWRVGEGVDDDGDEFIEYARMPAE